MSQADVNLSRRERQIMEILYAREQATASEVLADLPDPPSRTAVRTLLRILEEKGHVRHKVAGREFVYRPTRARARAGQSALRRVLQTFFSGSLEKAVAVHLADPSHKPAPQELDRLIELIEQARRREP
jgi:predicted transcriptional regulator